MLKLLERSLVVLVVVLLTAGTTLAQADSTGVLLLAHGGSAKWNEEVHNLAKQVDQRIPVEVAFGMASKRTMEEAADRLVRRGVRKVVAIPLFVSPHSSIVAVTEYLLGVQKDAPPELAAYAKMDHGGGGHDAYAQSDPTKPIEIQASVSMASALGRHPLVSEILLSRANDIIAPQKTRWSSLSPTGQAAMMRMRNGSKICRLWSNPSVPEASFIGSNT
jgi:hypothetical protein